MRGLFHELARLHPAELRERTVRRLVAPDALRRRQQRIAAVAILVVAVVLITVHDDFVADLPAVHLGANRPDDARGVGAGDMEWMFVAVERRNRNAEPRPDAVVVDSAGHHINQHFVFGDRPGRHHFELHRLLGRAVTLLADRPGVHFFRHMAERRDLADVVEVLERRGPWLLLRDGHCELRLEQAVSRLTANATTFCRTLCCSATITWSCRGAKAASEKRTRLGRQPDPSP